MKNLIILATILSVANLALSQTCTVSNDIDYFGNDFLEVTLPNPDECCTLCAKTFECVAWTYVFETQSCWLKHTVGEQKIFPSGSLISGIVSNKVPSTTGSPVPSTTAYPVPTTTGSPVPATTGSPVPTTTGSPVPSTTAYPVPSTTANQSLSQTCSVSYDIDFFGNDFYVDILPNPDECCTLCAKTFECVAWTYVFETQSCWLKHTLGQLKIASSGSLISGFVQNRIPTSG